MRKPRHTSAVIEELIRVTVDSREAVGIGARQVDVARRFADLSGIPAAKVTISRVEKAARGDAPLRIPDDLDEWVAAYASVLGVTPWQLWREAVARVEARATPLGAPSGAARTRARTVAQGQLTGPPTGSR